MYVRHKDVTAFSCDNVMVRIGKTEHGFLTVDFPKLVILLFPDLAMVVGRGIFPHQLDDT